MCFVVREFVEKAHQVNLEVARDLKDLANIIKEPEVFSRVAQAAMQPLVTCYTPRIDTFIKQHQVTIDAKQEKLSKHKSIDELMEMSNLPQYNITWGDKNNKEKAAMRNMAAIVWYFLKRKMCGTAPNVGNVADYFKVSRSQLSCLITTKKVQEWTWRLCSKEEKSSGRRQNIRSCSKDRSPGRGSRGPGGISPKLK